MNKNKNKNEVIVKKVLDEYYYKTYYEPFIKRYFDYCKKEFEYYLQPGNYREKCKLGMLRI